MTGYRLTPSTRRAADGILPEVGRDKSRVPRSSHVPRDGKRRDDTDYPGGGGVSRGPW